MSNNLLRNKADRKWRKKLSFMMFLLALSLGIEAHPVDMNTAREVGLKFMNANTNALLRSADELQLVTTYSISCGDAAFYIFNTLDGFVIVSADDCTTPILGYSEEGRFHVDNVPIQMQDYLQDFVEQIQYGIDNHLAADETIIHQWELVKSTGKLTEQRATTVVTPLLTDSWGQGCYYNSLCPEDPYGACGHVSLGCVATSLAQIIHYWGYPDVGTGSHTYTPLWGNYPTQTVNFGATTYQWADMPDYLSTTSSSAQINAVATLMWHCSVAVNTNYGASASGAAVQYIPGALVNYFNYSNDMSRVYRNDYTNSEWLAMMKDCLNLGRPIHYSSDEDNGGGGHAFVCDGYDANDFLHFNWGWYGGGNGYYAIGALNPYSYDAYNTDNEAIINIHPICSMGANYQVNVTANPSCGGSAFGMGNYGCGDYCTLTATANEGYTFVNWTEDGNIVSTDAIYSFTVTADRNLVANFTLPLTISAMANPLEGGTVSGMGMYVYGTICTLTATPDEGYVFYNWTENGAAVSYDAEYSFIVSSNRTLVANFSASGDGNHEYVDLGLPSGTLWATCNIGADNSEDYGDYFAWGETRPKVVYNYQNYKYGYFDDLNYEWNLYKYNTKSEFGPVDNLTVLQSSDDAATANWGSNWRMPTKTEFEELVNNTTFERITQNGVLGSRFTAQNGNSIFLPNAAYLPGSGNGVSDGRGYYWSSSLSVDFPYQAFILSCSNSPWVGDNTMGSFRYLGCSIRPVRASSQVFINATVNPTEGGTVNGGGTYQHGQICTLTATPNEGYMFMYWVDETGLVVSNQEEYTFVVTGDKTLTANFAVEGSICEITFNLEDSAGDGWNGNKIVVTYGDGNHVEITLENGSSNSQTLWIDNGNVILTWIEGGWIEECSFSVCYSNNNLIYYGSNLSSDFSYEFDVNCEEMPGISFDITAVVNPEEGGHVTGGGVFHWNETCTLTATANAGYTFINWTENGNQVSVDASYSFTVTEDRTLVANFMGEDGCVITIDLYDSFGDGWNGNQLVVTDDNGNSYEITLEDGSSSSHSLMLVNVSHITLSWIEGGWMDECSFTVSYLNGDVIYEGLNISSDLMIEFDVDCGGSIVINHDYVDLGLPSGLLWATCNVGANTPEEYGDYFAWGETQPKDIYSWSTYQYCNNGFLNRLTKYCSNSQYGYNGYSDNLTTLLPEDDAASANWGIDWRIPTQGEWLELLSNTTNTWTTQNGVYGRLFTAENGNSLFIPAAGYYGGSSLYDAGSYDYYWSSSVSTTTPCYAWIFGYFYSSNPNTNVLMYSGRRDYGRSVRAVHSGVQNLAFITTIAKPADGGMISGGGVYEKGTDCTLTAIANEGYAFNSWTINGEIVSTESSYTFTVTGSVNLTANFDCIDTIQLVAGWNWFSTYVDITLDELKVALVEALSGTAITIKSRTENTAFNPGTNHWKGTLNALDVSQMYMISVGNDCEITLEGMPVNPSEYSVTIHNGANWIAFPFIESMTISNAFAGFAINGDVIKSRTTNSSYINGQWRGGLNTLEPGRGYIYKSNAPDDRIFTFPIRTR